MIVLKYIAPIRIGHERFYFGIGKPVPPAVLKYWEKQGSIESLKRAGAIGDNESVQQNKTGQPKNSSEKIFDAPKTDKPQ